MTIKAIVGLGNPGNQYKKHRHNVGFMLLDKLLEKLASDLNWQKKFDGEMVKLNLDNKEIILLKPMNYMNNSGIAVRKMAQFFKVLPQNIIVVHDDIDLENARIKIKQNGGNGGHNGLKSIDQNIGSNYFRIRIGVGHPGRKELVSSYVLSDFSSSERIDIEKAMDYIIDNIKSIMENNSDSLNKLQVAFGDFFKQLKGK